eukprot:5842248-Alexandrium_andersonii.AAC.1
MSSGSAAQLPSWARFLPAPAATSSDRACARRSGGSASSSRSTAPRTTSPALGMDWSSGLPSAPRLGVLLSS